MLSEKYTRRVSDQYRKPVLWELMVGGAQRISFGLVNIAGVAEYVLYIRCLNELGGLQDACNGWIRHDEGIS